MTELETQLASALRLARKFMSIGGAVAEEYRIVDEALAAQQAAAPPPDGYALVPVEPTPEMCAAGFCVSEAEHDPAGVYRAMLAAFNAQQSAPSEPAQGEREAFEAAYTLKLLTIKDAQRAFRRLSHTPDEYEVASVHAAWVMWQYARAALASQQSATRNLAARVSSQSSELVALTDQERGELERLRALVNTPELHDFSRAVVLEAAHQRERWGSDHDAGKAPEDWFWLLGYLGGKALAAHSSGNTDKALHHTISSAAALANWHAAISGTHTAMRPGIDPVARGITAPAAVEKQG